MLGGTGVVTVNDRVPHATVGELGVDTVRRTVEPGEDTKGKVECDWMAALLLSNVAKVISDVMNKCRCEQGVEVRVVGR